MTREVVQFRICDRCFETGLEREAEVADKYSLNGHKFQSDLCRDHSAELYTLIMHTWGGSASKVGEPGVLDKPVRISTAPPPVTSSTAVPNAVEKRAPLQLVRAEEMPATAERWRLSQHALERMKERGFNIRDVLWAAERPQTITQSRTREGCEERVRGHCLVVVNPDTFDVLTVIQATQQRVEA